MSRERIIEIANESIEVKKQFFTDNAEKILKCVALITESIRNGGKLLIFGNGGSAADAQHIAAELVNRLSRSRPALPAIALTTDTSVLTSVANDYSFERVFERQMEALGRKGDIAIGLSTSGNSPNVLRAIEKAHSMGLTTIAITGGIGGSLSPKCDLGLIVHSESAQRIQETHITIGHILCELVEDSMFANKEI
jgi:D-sedoheptulose 7-phosphate isomerase